ncbi:MAG: hotdog fold thioesterase [Candidatus Pseudobacter hemicellulosilyticus]|uniref:Hotdog fold thioesterase n=1 Tax=Candidatus Pseudobacter hemicellulosilyticus TaxID=3121375 RepID=A0AAJ6BGM9_9BACT|nr:MAG: hotdog fold thioesterase [Pseudobacter sp.]
MSWFKQDLSVADLQSLGKGTMGEHLGIEFTEVGPDFLRARMPVDHRTRQPYGLLHGGASCVLSETLGSIGAAMSVDYNRFNCVGLEINANHIRSAREGFVTGIATPIHIGASTQVWETKIYDEREKLVCVSRLTVAVLPKKDKPV